MPRGIYDRQRSAEDPQYAGESPEAPQRAADTRRERRERVDGDVDNMARMKLAIPKEVQERAESEGKVLRWIYGSSNRLRQAQSTDWDPVVGVEPVAANADDDVMMILHEKYADWYADSQRRKMSRLDKMEEAMMSRRTESDPSGNYTPAGVEPRITRSTGA